jgi:hypothetical protein
MLVVCLSSPILALPGWQAEFGQVTGYVASPYSCCCSVKPGSLSLVWLCLNPSRWGQTPIGIRGIKIHRMQTSFPRSACQIFESVVCRIFDFFRGDIDASLWISAFILIVNHQLVYLINWFAMLFNPIMLFSD